MIRYLTERFFPLMEIDKELEIYFYSKLFT